LYRSHFAATVEANTALQARPEAAARQPESIHCLACLEIGSEEAPHPKECIDDLWLRMGEQELLRGHRLFDRELSCEDERASREALLQAVQHYAAAIGYFGRYSERVVERDGLLQQIYERFTRCRLEDIRYLRGEVLPTIVGTYPLGTSGLASVLDTMLRLAREANLQRAQKSTFRPKD